MAKHVVKLEDFVGGDWFKTHTLASSHGLGSNKDLFIESKFTGELKISSRFVVEAHGTRCLFVCLDDAIREYNES